MVNKKGALELSISTIVIIVLALTMLILGVVLVRSIMCKAMGLTDSVGKNAENEITKMFGATGEEVQCIGAENIVKMAPDSINFVWCGVRADITAKYELTITGLSSPDVSDEVLKTWLIESKGFSGNILPGDEGVKKAGRIRIPSNAPETLLIVDLAVTKDGVEQSPQSLDFQISRKGFIRATMC